MKSVRSFSANLEEFVKLKDMLIKKDISISKFLRDAIRAKIKELENEN